MIFWLIIAGLFCATFNEVQRGKEPSPRYWYSELEKEINHTADSLLNNWAEKEMRRYGKDSEVQQDGSGDGKPFEPGKATTAGTGNEVER